MHWKQFQPCFFSLTHIKFSHNTPEKLFQRMKTDLDFLFSQTLEKLTIISLDHESEPVRDEAFFWHLGWAMDGGCWGSTAARSAFYWASVVGRRDHQRWSWSLLLGEEHFPVCGALLLLLYEDRRFPSPLPVLLAYNHGHGRPMPGAKILQLTP